MHTICQHEEAHFRAMHKQENECKHAHKWYATKLDMAGKACQKESCKKASWTINYSPCKMQQNITGLGLSENQEKWAETYILLLYKQVQTNMQMNSNMT